MKILAAIVGWALHWFIFIAYGALGSAFFEKIHRKLSTLGAIICGLAGVVAFVVLFDNKYPGLDGAPWVEKYATALKFGFLSFEGLMLLAGAVLSLYIAIKWG